MNEKKEGKKKEYSREENNNIKMGFESQMFVLLENILYVTHLR